MRRRRNPLARRVIFPALFVVGLISSTRGAEPTALGNPAPPNILLILSDDQSAAHVGAYGNPDVRTPNLDRIASEGIRFNRAYVTAPQCVPSRASILTGRHPIDIGMTRFSAALPQDVAVFPEALKAEKGYFTGLAGRSFHLNGQGHDDPRIRPHLRPEDLPNMRARLDYVAVATGENLRKDTLNQLEAFLARVPEGKPFFLQLGWSDPHRPLTEEELPHRHDPATLTLPRFYPDSPAIRKDLAAYYDEVGRLDASVGEALAILDRHGLTKNTIVIFMGDNGASQLRGKGTLNEWGIRVPLIIRWPGVVKPNSTAEALISGEDLAPTLLQAAGIVPAKQITGVSFMPLLRGESFQGRTQLVSERGPHGSSLPRSSASFDLGRALVTDRYKLIYNATWQLPYNPVDFDLDDVEALQEAGKLDAKLAELYLAPSRPMFELYDLENDPSEMINLAGTRQARKIEDDLRGRLAAWQIRHRDFIPLALAKRRGARSAEK